MKIFDYENPLTGKKGNLLDFNKLLQLALGVVVIFFATASGQYLAKKFLGTTPLGFGVSGTDLTKIQADAVAPKQRTVVF